MGSEHILGKSASVFHNHQHLEPLCHTCSTGASKGEECTSRNLESILTSTQDTVVKYKKGELNHLSEDDIWAAKHLYDSAYHPDTGETLLDLWIKIVI